MQQLYIDLPKNQLCRGNETFDPWMLSWGVSGAAATEVKGGSSDRQNVTPEEAMVWLFATQKVRQVPVAVIGAKEASAEECKMAEDLGRKLGEVGYALLTGGRSGVMEAASRGASEAGGIVMGLLPDGEWETANPYVTIPLASGIGPTRNSIIARAARVLVAVGGGFGTITEMAYGLHYDRPVFALPSAPEVKGVPRFQDVDSVMAEVAVAFLGE
ncbi:TIGR00725 family protein [Thalassospira lucentensis]|uniref:TIGR00725 family protein n=1 Tax=Thalassospira lucentensis TaxID=168935 RepID=UPI003AA7BD23